jgi:hypothetical protein
MAKFKGNFSFKYNFLWKFQEPRHTGHQNIPNKTSKKGLNLK